MDASLVVRDANPGALVEERDSHLADWKRLARDCASAQSKWNACVPAEIAPSSSGNVQMVATK